MSVTATSIRHVTLEKGLLRLSTSAVSFKGCVFALLFLFVPFTSLFFNSSFHFVFHYPNIVYGGFRFLFRCMNRICLVQAGFTRISMMVPIICQHVAQLVPKREALVSQCCTMESKHIGDFTASSLQISFVPRATDLN